MQSKLKNKKGFTLVETLFGVAIFVVIVVVLTLFAKNILTSNSFIGAELSGVNSGRIALKTMVAEIRTASSGSNGAYLISQASPTSLTFFSDIYDNGLKEQIRYFLNGTVLKKGIIIPSGSPLAYTGAEIISTVIPYVTNASIFDYYDEYYDGTTAAMSPINISEISLIKITITTDLNPVLAPSPITFSTQVNLRNFIKDIP